MRKEIKTRAIAGHTRATIISWYPFDSGLVKFGTTPAGGGHAPTISAVEFMLRCVNAEYRTASSQAGAGAVQVQLQPGYVQYVCTDVFM